MNEPEETRDEKSLAEKIDYLFRVVRPAGRDDEWTYREVSEAIATRFQIKISPSYLWQLRHGGKDNPTKRHLEGLAAFFGVPVSYFFADDNRVAGQLELLAAMRDSGVETVALRAAELSAPARAMLAKLIEGLGEMEAEQKGKKGKR